MDGMGVALEAGEGQEHQHEKATTAQLIEALNHPIRRRILRVVAKEKSLTSTEIRQILGFAVGHNNYHFDTLVSCKALERFSEYGRREYRYACTPETNAKWFQQALRLSQEEDG
jgi:DNA-binding transcriptional ArsR family regulator